MQFVNDLFDLCLCGAHHRCSERFIVLSVLELYFSLLYILFDLFMMTVVVFFVSFFEVYGRVILKLF